MTKKVEIDELPPPLELECLNVLWRLGPSNVKQVREALLPSRPLAYTTVMTVLDRLVKRGAAERQKDGRSFRYGAQVPREQLQQMAVSQVIDRLFEGSPAMLLDFLRQAEENVSAITKPPLDHQTNSTAQQNPQSAGEFSVSGRPLDAELL